MLKLHSTVGHTEKVEVDFESENLIFVYLLFDLFPEH